MRKSPIPGAPSLVMKAKLGCPPAVEPLESSMRKLVQSVPVLFQV